MLHALVTGFLMMAAPESPATPAVAASQPEEKKICRKQMETGSLIKGKKLCYTARQWQKMADNARDDVERTAGSGSRSGQ